MYKLLDSFIFIFFAIKYYNITKNQNNYKLLWNTMEILNYTQSNNSESEAFILTSKENKKRQKFKWRYLDVRVKLLVALCALSIISNILFFFFGVSFKKSYSYTNDPQSITISNYSSYMAPISLLNASFMFNSINSFLKQKDCDVFPVGVSYVPASIPKDTVVYHAGSGIPDSYEWVAMDVEFSMNFAERSRSAKRGTAQIEQQRELKLHPRDGKKYGPRKDIDFCEVSENTEPFEMQRSKPGKERKPSTLMSFRLKHDLDKLIYLDGASASKTSETGEMDTQALLYNKIKENNPGFDDGPEKFMIERDYAEKICKWGQPLGIQGYIRLELGFEFVLCDFNEHLEMISDISVTSANKFLDLPEPVELSKKNGWPINCTDGYLIEEELTADQREILELEDLRYKHSSSLDAMNGWEWLKAGNKHNKGEKKINLDYRYLVTAINKTELDADNYKWRIVEDSEESKDLQSEIFSDLLSYYSNVQSFEPAKSTNWQLKTEGIMEKFTPYFKNIELVLNDVDMSMVDKALKINQLLNPLIKRYADQYPANYNVDEIINTGVWEYTYPTHDLKTEADKLIFSSLATVMKEIFTQLINIHELSLTITNEYLKNGKLSDSDKYEASLDEQQESILNLISTLNWISFGYECSLKCGIDEVCFTPSWGPSPMGWNSIKEREREGPPSDKARELAPGFFSDVNTGFTRINSEQMCIGLSYMLDRDKKRDF